MSPESLTLAPGALVDNLRIDRVLGRGAFAVTYLVTDQVLNKSFALKEFLPPEQVVRAPDNSLQPANEAASAAFSAGMKRFVIEGRTVAQLDHANIVKVIRCFEANGTAYLLMPWYRGEALHKLLKRSGTLTVDETTALAIPLLDALDYIHRNGLFHLDIKPANIYITETGQPILLDFGAAGQLLDGGQASGPRHGSEGYAAPEQSDGSDGIGPWTDIYSLAATLYRCISGRIPASASQRNRDLLEHRNDPLIPIGRLVSAREYAGVTRAIEQGLAIAPGARPQSVQKWRGAFGTTTRSEGAAGAGYTGEIEQEGKEWLPIILLSIFAVVLLGAVIYLFTGEAPDLDDSSAGQVVESSEPSGGEVRGRPESPEERARWQSALEADTAYGYQLFLEDFPDSIHEDQAVIHLERLDHQAWGYAQEQETKSAIETYMENFPGGRHVVDAKILLHEFDLAEQAAQRAQLELEQQDNDAWDKARLGRTTASIDAYLAAWPAGLHGDQARTLRRQLEKENDESRAFQAARKLNTIDAYQSYVSAFPQGRNVAEALETIDELTLRPGKSFRDCPACPSMMVVPAGSFWQGSEETNPAALKKETPRRMVTFARPFAVSVFEVTLAQWDRCVAEGGCKSRPADNGWGRGSRPAIMVSWNDAQEFTSWLSTKTGQSYSLPSESQWEYVARAGEESDWLGGDPARACEFGNIAGGESGFRWQHNDCSDPAAIETLPVGSFKPNAFGLHDVIGNVAEWTLDCMNLSYLDAPADGSAWGRGICNSRMTRGGSWFTGTREIRLPARFNLKNGDRNDFTGFRVVRTVEEQ
jgi:formylglycine-generating enzyme required for sulfatase activity/serine/threonine protein kinase